MRNQKKTLLVLLSAFLALRAEAANPCLDGDAVACKPVQITVSQAAEDATYAVRLDLLSSDGSTHTYLAVFLNGQATVSGIAAHLKQLAVITTRQGSVARWILPTDKPSYVLDKLVFEPAQSKYVDLDGAPIPGLHIGSQPLVTDLEGKARYTPQGPVQLPGGAWVNAGAVRAGIGADRQTVTVPARRIFLAPKGVIYDQERPASPLDDLPAAAAVGLWLPIGTFVHEYVEEGKVFRQTITVTKESPPVIAAPEPAQGIEVRLVDRSRQPLSKGSGVKPTSYPVLPGEPGTVIAYPRTFPARIETYGSGYAGRTVLLEANETEQEVRFREPAGSEVHASECWPGLHLRPYGEGLWVVDSREGSPLRTGDVILKVRGAATKGWDENDFVAKLVELGQDAALKVRSGPKEREVMLRYEPQCGK